MLFQIMYLSNFLFAYFPFLRHEECDHQHSQQNQKMLLCFLFHSITILSVVLCHKNTQIFEFIGANKNKITNLTF